MRYESAKTPRGNVGVSYSSQAEADAQAAAMDEAHCSYCSGCSDCSDCSQWSGPNAKNLNSWNGLKWPISTDGEHIQIGCQNHAITEWESFSDDRINEMSDEALEWWRANKTAVLAWVASCATAK